MKIPQPVKINRIIRSCSTQKDEFICNGEITRETTNCYYVKHDKEFVPHWYGKYSYFDTGAIKSKWATCWYKIVKSTESEELND